MFQAYCVGCRKRLTRNLIRKRIRYHIECRPKEAMTTSDIQSDTECVSGTDVPLFPLSSAGEAEVVENPSKQNPKVKIDAEFDRTNMR